MTATLKEKKNSEKNHNKKSNGGCVIQRGRAIVAGADRSLESSFALLGTIDVITTEPRLMNNTALPPPFSPRPARPYLWVLLNKARNVQGRGQAPSGSQQLSFVRGCPSVVGGW